ncbi:MAG TPA: hypothetical protein VGP05_01015 [Pseudonocardia sp.]|jgi:hypothetical protein|nr:hypothetical protein [Pseudonocardia sp.]
MADTSSGAASPSPIRLVVTAVAWLWVLVPFLWGVWQLLVKVVPLFSG